MERKSCFFKYQQTSLHYSIYGKGSKPIFFFHGFGLNGTIFYELEELLGAEYTIYNFDLPFHGESQWKEGGEAISESFWKDWLDSFCLERNIDSFSLLGYSIGARLVWLSVLTFPDKVKEVIVLAPDGIKTSFWYLLATGTTPTRTVFKTILFRNYIQTLLRVGRFLHLAPKAAVRFAESQLVTEVQRVRVYNTWVLLRKAKADIKKTAALMNQYQMALTVYLGAQDKIITYDTIRPLTDQLKRKNIVTLSSGHSNLVHKAAEYIRSSSSRST